MADEADDLARLLDPVAPADFFGQYWDRRPLHIPGSPGKFANLFSRAAFDRAAPTCATLKANFKDARSWHVDVPIQPVQVAKMLEAGMTICAGHVDAHDPVLTEFLRRYRRAVRFAGTVYFNAYLSPAGKGFGLHFDDHPVWILQIEGAKRWRFSVDERVVDPPQGISMPPDRDVLPLPWGTIHRPDESRFAEVLLEPGGILYLPTGFWHQARAEGQSLGLTLAALGVTPLELLQRALAPRLAADPVMRARLPGDWVANLDEHGTPGALRDPLVTTMQTLRSTIAQLTDQDLHAAWAQMTEDPGNSKR